MKKLLSDKYFLTSKNSPWEKPLYLCLWNDPDALPFDAPIYWLYHTGRFDLIGIAADGTAVLAEVKATLKKEADVQKLEEKLESIGKAVRQYRKTRRQWDGKTSLEWRDKVSQKALSCCRGCGHYPYAFRYLKHYGPMFAKAETGWMRVLDNLERTPIERCPDFNGRLAIFFVANEVSPEFVARLKPMVQRILGSWNKGRRRSRVTITLVQLGAESKTGRPAPSVR